MTEDRRRTTEISHRSAVRRLWPLVQFGASLILATFLLGVALAVEGDVVFKRKEDKAETPAAVFPHWVHRIRYKCYACHPVPFRMKAGATPVSMELIQEGKSCGLCHNGKGAWGVTNDTCTRCHAGH